MLRLGAALPDRGPQRRQIAAQECRHVEPQAREDAGS
jgi:hypothetical protein